MNLMMASAIAFQHYSSSNQHPHPHLLLLLLLLHMLLHPKRLLLLGHYEGALKSAAAPYWRRGFCRAAVGLFQLANLRMHTGGAHGWCSWVGRRHATRAQQRGALHAPLPARPPWYHLGAAVANYVCASVNCALLRMRRQRVLRVFGEPMAVRTDADRRKRGRVPAIGDWAAGVHRGVPRAYLQNAGPKRRRSGGARERRKGGNQQRNVHSSDPPVVSTYLDPPALKVDMTSGYDMRRVGRLVIYYPHAIDRNVRIVISSCLVRVHANVSFVGVAKYNVVSLKKEANNQQRAALGDFRRRHPPANAGDSWRLQSRAALSLV